MGRFWVTGLLALATIAASSGQDRGATDGTIRVGWLLPTDNDCWKKAADIAASQVQQGATIVMAKSDTPSTRSSALKNMYQNGVRVFIGLSDGDEPLIEAYPDATFVTPFPTRTELRHHPRVYPVSASSEDLSRTGVKKMKLYFEHGHVKVVQPIIDTNSRKDWEDIYRPLLTELGSITVAEPIYASDINFDEEIITESRTGLLFLPRLGLSSFLTGLQLSSTNARHVTEIFAPNAILEENKFPLREFRFGIHTWTYMGDRQGSESVRRGLFKALERKLQRQSCDPSAAFVYDAALVAANLASMQSTATHGSSQLHEASKAVPGATGRFTVLDHYSMDGQIIPPPQRDRNGEVVTMFRRPLAVTRLRLSMMKSPWVPDGAYRILEPAGIDSETTPASREKTIIDAAAEKYQHADSRVFSRRTYADCHYFTHESIKAFQEKFPANVIAGCHHVSIDLRVDDPLNYATTEANFSLDAFPPILAVPTASGYEMSVTCEDSDSTNKGQRRNDNIHSDNGEGHGREALLEVSCPGLESETDVCVHKFTALKKEGRNNATPTAMRRPYFAIDSRDVRRRNGEVRRSKRSMVADLIFNTVGKKMILDGQRYYQNRPESKRRTSFAAPSRRIDLYAPAGMYEQKRIRPGFITKMLLAATPSLMGCYGRIYGCMECIVFRATIRLDTLGCTPPCAAGVGSFCGAASGEMVKKYFGTFSVICSELFRQGKMDLKGFRAESRFGASFCKSNPDAMVGYHLLASPIVSLMKQSSAVSSMVSWAVSPWLRHTQHLEGLSSNDDSFGSWVHDYGSVVTGAVGSVAKYLTGYQGEHPNCVMPSANGTDFIDFDSGFDSNLDSLIGFENQIH